jgi:hypothetical protein
VHEHEPERDARVDRAAPQTEEGEQQQLIHAGSSAQVLR